MCKCLRRFQQLYNSGALVVVYPWLRIQENAVALVAVPSFGPEFVAIELLTKKIGVFPLAE
jgi:hypothetical protein